MENNQFCFMAFGKGFESKEVEIKRYWGVAPVNVVAVNPTAKELSTIYNTEITNEPEYLGTTQVGDKEVPQVRIDFLVKTVKEKTGIELVSRMSYFLRKAYRYNKDNTKVQVIDKYGRTTWVTIEQCKNHEIPANVLFDKDYRPCFIGEEGITEFMRNFLNIPLIEWKDKQSGAVIKNPGIERGEFKLEDCIARFTEEDIKSLFSGNISPIKDVVAGYPTFTIKVLFGVRNTEDNKQYQAIYTDMILRGKTKDYSKLQTHVENRKANGGYATTEFKVVDLTEYKVEPTNFEAPTETPFDETPAEDNNLPFDF